MSRLPVPRVVVALLAVHLTACGHTDPGTTGPSEPEGPLLPTPPARLTYSNATDAWPGYSLDGTRLVYTYERVAGDPDRCLGVLPGRGGQRLVEVCPPFRPLREGIEHGAVSPSGQVAYTLHVGNSGAFPSSSAALYVAPLDSLVGARKLFDLLATPPGAPRRWDYLMHPVWLSDTELAFLGTQVAFIPPIPFADPDTVYTQIDLATVRIDGGAPVITTLANVVDAEAMSYDPTVQRFVILRHDSVFTIARGGGAEAFAYALPDVPGEFGRSITGVAAGGGRIFLSWTTARTTGSQSALTSSVVSQLGAGGALVDLDVRERFVADGATVRDEGTWGRLTSSGDGRRLAAEGRGGTTGNDIYLFELP